LNYIFNLSLEYKTGTKTVYSDIGIIVLGKIIERVTGMSLAEFCRTEIFEPLGMKDTMFNPPEYLLNRIAPTEYDPERGGIVQGKVHDENSYYLGGVAAHAGLFSTAPDLSIFMQMLLNYGVYDGKRYIEAETIKLFTRRQNLVEGSSRALGWDTPGGKSSSGRYFSTSSFGHTGFTGTSIWADPEKNLFVILLTNRVHPTRENLKILKVRRDIHDIVMESLMDVKLEVNPDVEIKEE
jgi:CubicO group peptidase (beta-lactamase class C family)